MTFRAILIGLLLGLSIAGFGYFNDWVLKQAYVASDLVPVSVYGLLVLGLLVANPLLRLIRQRQFKESEWCVIASLMLVACVIPSPGLMWNFSNSLVMPHHFQQVYPGWQKHKSLSYVPKVMLVNADLDRDVVVYGFKEGLRGERGVIGFNEVPWSAWRNTLSFWMLLIGLSFVAGICLVLIIHSQWARRERLRYPIAEFVSELIQGSGEQARTTIFRNRRFWMGFIPVLVVLLINGFHAWERYLPWELPSINIPLDFSFEAVRQKWPSLRQVPNSWRMFNTGVYFAVVGFTYFVSTDVSLSLGLSHILFTVVFLAVVGTGVEMGSEYSGGGVHSSQLFGAFLGMGLALFYAGRKYYLSVLRYALGIPTAERIEPSIIRACRLMLLASACMVLIMVFALGLHWLLAVLFVMLVGLMFLVITRISAETGLFFVQPCWWPAPVLLGVFGMAALGPNMLAILAMMGSVMVIDPRVCLMPLVANALRFSELRDVRPARLSKWLTLAVLMALVFGMIVTIYVQYNYGGGRLYEYANNVAKFPFELLNSQLQRFGGDASAWQSLRLEHIKANEKFLWAVGAGLAMVLVCSALRLRFTWWPIHPVVFLVWGTFGMGCMAASFLLGWFIKVAVTRFGGFASYRRAKPIFVGMIAGEFVGGIFWAIVGLIYYMNTGVAGPIFRVHL